MFTTVDGIRIFYEVKGDGMPVVYVHGNFASSKWFEDVMDIEGLKIYALDMPNFGNSDGMGEFSIEKYAYYLWNFIQSLKIENSILVGHSLGGAVTLKCVIDHLEAFAGLLLVDPAPANGLKTSEIVFQVLESFKDHPDFLEKSLEGIIPSRKKMAKNFIKEAMKMDPIAFTENARALERYDYSNDLSKINIPVKILWGELDLIVPRNALEKMAHMIPNAQFEMLDGIGHSPIVENPKKFVEILMSFKDDLRK